MKKFTLERLDVNNISVEIIELDLAVHSFSEKDVSRYKLKCGDQEVAILRINKDKYGNICLEVPYRQTPVE